MPLELDWSTIHDVVILTGAGASAPSGLPTYRGPGGLWDDGVVARMSHADTLAADPHAVWAYWTGFRELIATVEPNPVHDAIAALARRLGVNVHLVTQNVDGLHQRAGSPLVHELHGSVNRTRCTQCDLEPYDDEAASEQAPACPECGAPLRVDVVLFGEQVALDAEVETKRALRDVDLFVAVGTSGTVWPAASYVRGADYAGGETVLVNLEPLDPPNPYFHHVLVGRAELLLPELLSA
jgi:NAD-dependent deacetylase